MTRKEWLVKFKGCRWKIATRRDYDWTGKHGNFMCGKWFPFGKRCMYKICPFIKEGKNEPTYD